jgi:hypothetical protein
MEYKDSRIGGDFRPNDAHHWNIKIPGLEMILGLKMPTNGIERFQDWR